MNGQPVNGNMEAPSEHIEGSCCPPSGRRLGGGGIAEHIRWFVWLTVLGMASYVIASHYVAEMVQVQGSSMAPTLRDADRYFLDHLTYLWRAPQRGDIVVVRDPADGSKAVKRIIAAPGDLLYLKNGRVY